MGMKFSIYRLTKAHFSMSSYSRLHYNFPIFRIFWDELLHTSTCACMQPPTADYQRSRNLSIPHPRQSSIERNERGYPLRITGCKSGITIRSWTSITHAGRNDAQPRSSAPPRILLNVITWQELPPMYDRHVCISGSIHLIVRESSTRTRLLFFSIVLYGVSIRFTVYSFLCLIIYFFFFLKYRYR